MKNEKDRRLSIKDVTSSITREVDCHIESRMSNSNYKTAKVTPNKSPMNSCKKSERNIVGT